MREWNAPRKTIQRVDCDLRESPNGSFPTPGNRSFPTEHKQAHRAWDSHFPVKNNPPRKGSPQKTTRTHGALFAHFNLKGTPSGDLSLCEFPSPGTTPHFGRDLRRFMYFLDGTSEEGFQHKPLPLLPKWGTNLISCVCNAHIPRFVLPFPPSPGLRSQPLFWRTSASIGVHRQQQCIASPRRSWARGSLLGFLCCAPARAILV